MKESLPASWQEYAHIHVSRPVRPAEKYSRWLWLLSCIAVLIFVGTAAVCWPMSETQGAAETGRPADSGSAEATPVVSSTKVVTVEIPYKVQWKKTEKLSVGEYGREREGKPGECVLVYKTETQNGRLLSQKLVTQRVTAQPVDEIRLVGSWPAEKTLILPDGTRIRYDSVTTCQATAYTYNVGRASITATGRQARVGLIAVDPTVIPYHTRMFIMTPNGSYIYGEAVAEDCGGGVKGDRVDLFMETYDECVQFGRRNVDVYFLPDDETLGG